MKLEKHRDSEREANRKQPSHRLIRPPFHQLHRDEVVPVSAVEEEEAVGRSGFELEEEVHGGVGLQRGQAQVAALRLKRYGVGDDEAHAEARVQLAEVDVPVFAHVDVLHAVELEALWGQKTGRACLRGRVCVFTGLPEATASDESPEGVR